MDRIRTELTWAFLFLLFTIFWMITERAIGLHDQYIHFHPYVSSLIIFPTIGVYYLAFRNKRNRDYPEKMTFGQGFLSGMILTLFLTAAAPGLQTLISLVITPHFFDHAIAYAVKSGHSTREQATGYFNLESYIKQSTLGTFAMGTVFSLAFAWFMKRPGAQAKVS